MSRGYDYNRKRITHVEQRRSERWTVITLLVLGGGILGVLFYMLAVR